MGQTNIIINSNILSFNDFLNFYQFLLDDVVSEREQNLPHFLIVVVRIHLVIQLVLDHPGSHTVLPGSEYFKDEQLIMFLRHDRAHYSLPLPLNSP